MARRQRYGRAIGLVHLGVAISLIGAAPAAARPLIVWAFGDSLTAGLGLPPQQGFPAQLEARLRQSGLDVSVRNGGVSGDTVAQARARLRWGLRGLGTPPDLVIVELGGNDMLRGLPVAQARDNLDRILAELAGRHIPVLLAGMRASPNMGPDYVRAFDGLYPVLAHRYRVAFYPFFLDGVATHPALIQADGIHPDAKGVAIIVGRMAPAVRAALPDPVARRSSARASSRR